MGLKTPSTPDKQTTGVDEAKRRDQSNNQQADHSSSSQTNEYTNVCTNTLPHSCNEDAKSVDSEHNKTET